MNLQKIKRQLAADKKKLGILTTLMLVGLLMWGRLLLAGAPKTAIAKPTSAAPVADAVAPAAPVASTTRDMPVVEVDLFQRVDRDVFAFSGGAYPPSIQPDQPNVVTTLVAKYESDPADKARELEQTIRAAAARLKLQSTILGNQPRAVIDGVLLAPGESIQGFVVESIASRAVTLKKETVTITLEM